VKYIYIPRATKKHAALRRAYLWSMYRSETLLRTPTQWLGAGVLAAHCTPCIREEWRPMGVLDYDHVDGRPSAADWSPPGPAV
jgi:hypothetical protein